MSSHGGTCFGVMPSLFQKIKIHEKFNKSVFFRSQQKHIVKSGIFENNGLTIGEKKNAIEKFYTLLLT